MKVAVIGSGVSGLAATWLLNEHSDHTVHLYEADSRPGGHAHTVQFTPPKVKDDSLGIAVDTGFIVFNPSTYPNFLRFLRTHASTKDCILPTEMTFSVSRDGGAFEWAGKNLGTVFCQLRNLLEPDMWRLVWDVARFNACAGRFLSEEGHDKEMPIGEYLDREGYSSSFRDNYLIPMTAAIWSTPPDKCTMDFPARTLIQFLHNHHLLQVTGKPSWLTLKGGSKVYVDQILSALPESQLHLSTRVQSIAVQDPTTSRTILNTSHGPSDAYDHVIFACHSDAVLEILRASGEGGITQEEEEILSAFEWSKNEAVLHADDSLMPRSRLAWSCWNYLTRSVVDSHGRRKANEDTVALTDGMNDLQHIPESIYGPVLVTLNPPFEPKPDLLVGRWRYDHPILNAKAVYAQKQMHKIQGKRGISYAGAYLRYGFHEDGFTSGLVAAAALGSHNDLGSNELTKVTVRPPFPIEYAEKEVKRTTLVVIIAALFDLVEALGVRWFVGLVGSTILGMVGWATGVHTVA
ncbi:hypothetical protein BDZ94DRAFT_1320407 [Collybia nuda]|uniref:Amine oxidase domain-containing protein n=1 Tax=Collybia nuda TaxID=64659 RepID=A0A9P5Y9V3_9AGAR|nr:hypothetical protein BDZ94DRAFT_1320407 [Collybia nuda]